MHRYIKIRKIGKDVHIRGIKVVVSPTLVTFDQIYIDELVKLPSSFILFVALLPPDLFFEILGI